MMTETEKQFLKALSELRRMAANQFLSHFLTPQMMEEVTQANDMVEAMTTVNEAVGAIAAVLLKALSGLRGMAHDDPTRLHVDEGPTGEAATVEQKDIVEGIDLYNLYK